jgi:hypothetical protein
MRELKKVAPKAFNFFNNAISEAKKSMHSVKGLARILNKSLESTVEEVYGVDGLKYLQHLKGA